MPVSSFCPETLQSPPQPPGAACRRPFLCGGQLAVSPPQPPNSPVLGCLLQAAPGIPSGRGPALSLREAAL